MTAELLPGDDSLRLVTELIIGANKDKVQVALDTEMADTWVPSSDCSDHKIRYDLFTNGSTSTNPKNVTLRNDYGEFIPKGNPTPVSYFTTKTTEMSLYSTADGHSETTQILAGYSVKDVSVCTQHGSFNTDTLDTIHKDGNWIIGSNDHDDTYFAGFYVNDDVYIPYHTVKQLRFGAVDSTNLDIGTLGLGLPQSLDLTSGDSADKKYQSLMIRLKTEKLIQKIAYSISVNANDSVTGEIIFGAIDHYKYTGELQKVKILNRFRTYRYGIPLLPEIALDSITGPNFEVDERIAVSLATRYFGSYLPEAYTSKLRKHLNATLNAYGYWEVSCDYLALGEEYIFHFSGQEIRVPESDLVVSSESGKTCFLNIYSEEIFPKLGLNFLRNAYVVVDVEDYEVALAQAAALNPDKLLVEISSDIPSAITASGYNNTSVNDYVTSIGLLWSTFSTDIDYSSSDEVSSSLSKGIGHAASTAPLWTFLSAFCAIVLL